MWPGCDTCPACMPAQAVVSPLVASRHPTIHSADCAQRPSPLPHASCCHNSRGIQRMEKGSPTLISLASLHFLHVRQPGMLPSHPRTNPCGVLLLLLRPPLAPSATLLRPLFASSSGHPAPPSGLPHPPTHLCTSLEAHPTALPSDIPCTSLICGPFLCASSPVVHSAACFLLPCRVLCAVTMRRNCLLISSGPSSSWIR